MKISKEEQKKTLIQEIHNLNHPKSKPVLESKENANENEYKFENKDENKHRNENESENGNKNKNGQNIRETKILENSNLENDVSDQHQKLNVERKNPEAKEPSNNNSFISPEPTSLNKTTDNENINKSEIISPKERRSSLSNTTNLRKTNKNRSKSFIVTKHNNNYSLHQKARLSDVSMNIKQNILNDIMSFSPVVNNVSPSPFLMNENERQNLKKRNLFESPKYKKFEIAKRESEREHEQRRKSEFLNKILYGDKIKKEEEENEKRKEKEKEKRRDNFNKAENYKVQWVTIDEIRKNKNSDESSSNVNLPFEITPIKSGPSEKIDSFQIESDNIYTTPVNTVRYPQHDNSESNPFIDSSSKITTFISKITRSAGSLTPTAGHFML